MGPRKGLSFEEKRERLQEIFTETVKCELLQVFPSAAI